MSIASRITSIEGHIGDIYDSVELTGVDTTDIDKNLVNVPNTLKEGYIDIINNGTDTLYENFPKVSGENTSLTLNNTYQAPMRNLLKGNTSQTGTPTPSSPIPVNVASGDNTIIVNSKNQLETYNVSGTLNGVDYTFQDGVLTLNGTCSSTGQVTGLGIFRQSKGINYKWSYVYESGTCTDYGGGLYMADTPTSTSSAGYGAGFRTSSSRTAGNFNNGQEHIYYLYMAINKNYSFTNYKVKPLIVEGDDYSYDFEPYNGDTYNIDLPVENLFDGTIYKENYVISSTGAESYNSNFNLYKMNLKPNTTYTIQFKSTDTIARSSRYIAYKSNDTFIEMIFDFTYNANESVIKTFTTPNETSYIIFHTGKLVENIQVEKGSKANSYTSYGTTPIELCKIGNYQDYIYKDSDKWYLHKEIGKVASYNGETITTSYKSTTGGLDTGATVYYGLSTPTTTEITYQPLIDQLNELEKAISYENKTNISQINNDLGFIISASALKKGV